VHRFGLLMTLALTIAACAPSTQTATEATTANDSRIDAAIRTLDDMLAAARAGDWERYVSFYGEQHKFDSDADRAALVARFRDQWGAQVVQRLSRASGLAPRIEGTRAIFEMDGEAVVVLHADDAGRWTFHL